MPGVTTGISVHGILRANRIETGVQSRGDSKRERGGTCSQEVLIGSMRECICLLSSLKQLLSPATISVGHSIRSNSGVRSLRLNQPTTGRQVAALSVSTAKPTRRSRGWAYENTII